MEGKLQRVLLIFTLQISLKTAIYAIVK